MVRVAPPTNILRSIIIENWKATRMNQVPTPVKTSALAIWSLVLGILGFLCFSFFTGIPAIICGHMGRSKIRESQGALQGDGLALAGLILGYIGTIVTTLGIVAAIAIPAFVAYRDKAYCAMAQAEAVRAATAVSCYVANRNPASPPTLADLASDAQCGYTPGRDADVEISGSVEALQVTVYDTRNRCSLGDRYVISLPDRTSDGWQ
jgi:Tfp pilus assembly protein PilE